MTRRIATPRHMCRAQVDSIGRNRRRSVVPGEIDVRPPRQNPLRVPGPDREPPASAPGRAAPRTGTPDFRAEIERAWEILGRLNALPPGDFDAMRALLGELTGHEIDP